MSKWSTPRPTSSSTVKPTRIGACSISGCATRYATAPMISATPALSSAPRSVVPAVVTMSCLTRAARIGLALEQLAEVALLRGARVRRRILVGRRVDADVAEEALEDVRLQL